VGRPRSRKSTQHSTGSPCPGRSAEAPPHQLTTTELRGSGAATTSKKCPMSSTDKGVAKRGPRHPKTGTGSSAVTPGASFLSCEEM